MGFLVAVLGLSIGSFLNVLIWRLNDPKAPKFWQGRSVCPRCRRPIEWYDNIPLLSFLFLRGQCRYCRRKISWQYPVVEMVTAAAFWFVGWQPVLWILASVFIVIFFSDLMYGLIPDEMVAVGMLVALLLRPDLLTAIFSALGFLAIVLATGFKGMGLGDVKLAFLIGLLLGWPSALVAFWLSFVLGGTAALALVVLKRVKFSDRIAFGPYLVAGFVISALWSNSLLSAIP